MKPINENQTVHPSALAGVTNTRHAKKLLAQVRQSVIDQYWTTIKHGNGDFWCEIIIPDEGVRYAFIGTGYIGQSATYDGIGITPEVLG